MAVTVISLSSFVHPGLPLASAIGKASRGVKTRGKIISVPDNMCPDGNWNSLWGAQGRVYPTSTFGDPHCLIPSTVGLRLTGCERKVKQGRSRAPEGRLKLRTGFSNSRSLKTGSITAILTCLVLIRFCVSKTQQSTTNESIHLPTGLQLSWHAPAVRPFNSTTVHACVCTAALCLQTPPRKNNQTAL